MYKFEILRPAFSGAQNDISRRAQIEGEGKKELPFRYPCMNQVDRMRKRIKNA
jgi:hypothetical protein